jgi:hypothetical protein
MPASAHSASRRRIVRSEHPGVAIRSYPLPCTKSGHDVLEDHPAGYPAAVAAQRVLRVKLRGLTAGQRAELDPGRLQKA